MKKIYSLDKINKLKLDIKLPCIIFLKGDLWAWKTTLSKHIINNLLWVKEDVTSPTYTYYNRYSWETLDSKFYKYSKNIENSKFETLDIYHFDLYRLKNYDEFFIIGGEDILDNNSWVVLIEWPEIIKNYYKPDIEISLSKTKNEEEREIQIVNN